MNMNKEERKGLLNGLLFYSFTALSLGGCMAYIFIRYIATPILFEGVFVVEALKSNWLAAIIMTMAAISVLLVALKESNRKK